jgi:glucose/arabinose dehydrogenase
LIRRRGIGPLVNGKVQANFDLLGDNLRSAGWWDDHGFARHRPAGTGSVSREVRESLNNLWTIKTRAGHQVRFFIAMMFLLFGLSFSASAATLPTGFVETTVASGIASPTAMAIAPNGRIFVCSQTGALRVIKNGVLLATPFVTLSVDSVGERGLLGVAFDPHFTLNQYIYLYYTVPGTPAHNRVVRFTANGDVVLPGSRVILLELDPLSTAINHNGGALHFGPRWQPIYCRGRQCQRK